MTLSEKEYDIVNFVEQEYLLHGLIPTAEKIEELGLATKKWYSEFLTKEDVRKSLVARGVSLGEQFINGETYVLTEEQLTAANVMLDLGDNRSRKKKLADLRISTQKWEGWMKDPAFQHYVKTRAENLLGSSQHEAHLALLDTVRKGDVSAIKYFNELTGRYAPARDNNIDLPALLMRVLEIIQRHVADDEALRSIANDMMTLANGMGLAVGPSVSARELPVSGGVVNL